MVRSSGDATPPAPVKLTRAEKRRAKVLAAARAVLGRQGLEGTAVGDIIAEAKISRATFYRAFHSVEEVMNALYADYEAHVLKRLHDALEQAQHEGSAAEESDWLEGLVATVLDDAHRLGPFLPVLFAEELRPGSKAKRHQQRRVRNQVEALCRWWEAHSQTPADEALILCFVSMLQSVGLYLGSGARSAAEREALKEAALFVLRTTTTAYRTARQGE